MPPGWQWLVPDDAPPPEPAGKGKRTGGWGRATRAAIENPLWTTLGAIVGIVGLVISGFQIYEALKTPPVELEVASVTLDGRQSVGAEVTESGGPDPVQTSVEVTPIDITLQNKGGEPSLITRIDATVVYFRQLQDCTGTTPAPGRAAADYQLKVPLHDTTLAEKSITTEIRFEVKPDAADRMVLTLGPDLQPAYATAPMVMAVKLVLVHDDDQRKEIGTVSVVTTAEAAEAQIAGPLTSPEAGRCVADNLADLNEMFAIQATRSSLLDRLRSTYQRAAK
ncbi:hypothetical protein [Gordonia alkaliphila]|uniref:DUF4352 domain-containing protein n=1 Tax=Gordonia alkaliphila TaxID=1053547 RepID=A0ABP8Z295_9ACTN